VSSRTYRTALEGDFAYDLFNFLCNGRIIDYNLFPEEG